jgi:hypothetical protein
MTDLTFIIPIAPRHTKLAERAIASVRAQTVQCELLTMHDNDARGPGVLRNAMLAQVETPFVSFLDADDWIEPTFAEDTINEWHRVGGNNYIYTDWLEQDGSVVETPCLNGIDGRPMSVTTQRPYCGGTWHVITTLIPTAWAREVGGFDQSMKGVEDTDFYLKLCTTFRCGHRLPKALFHYSPGGGRAIDFRNSEDYDRTMRDLSLRYGGRMGCCGDEQAISAPIGQKQEGDVLAMALWQGNRGEHGRVTGRPYPRISVPKTAWVDPRDAAHSPQLWRVIEQATVDQRPIEPTKSLVDLAEMSFKQVNRKEPNLVHMMYSAPINEPPPPPVQIKPDIERVIRLGRTAQKSIDEPIFVFPEKDYPSYSDIKRLVQLSGFDSVTFKGIDAFSKRPHIVVSPEAIPDMNSLRTRVICWQLEYTGDYTDNYKGFTGEVWASDKAWSAANGAKYVLMGSHPALAETDPYGAPPTEPHYDDVTMLAYMTPRRQVIKNSLSNLKWGKDYPGHGGVRRSDALRHTRLMLHVHQNENAPYIAPQRWSLAAAYKMPLISEAVLDTAGLDMYSIFVEYSHIAEFVTNVFADGSPVLEEKWGDRLHQHLCIERPFRRCVEEAIKS